VINPARLAHRKRPDHLVFDDTIFAPAIDLDALGALRAPVGSVVAVVSGNTAFEFLVPQKAH
jgi:hypothetical protein